MDKVIRAGVKTKVLMLSATPVNNRFVDLKNQLALAYEGNSEYINDKLDTKKPIEEIFRQAQKAFNAWSKLEPEARTTDALLRTLDLHVPEGISRSIMIQPRSANSRQGSNQYLSGLL